MNSVDDNSVVHHIECEWGNQIIRGSIYFMNHHLVTPEELRNSNIKFHENRLHITLNDRDCDRTEKIPRIMNFTFFRL